MPLAPYRKINGLSEYPAVSASDKPADPVFSRENRNNSAAEPAANKAVMILAASPAVATAGIHGQSRSGPSSSKLGSGFQTKPIAPRRTRVRAPSGRSEQSRPSMVMRPALGCSSRPAACSNDDLPDPDGPTSPTISPGNTSISTPRSTGSGPAPVS